MNVIETDELSFRYGRQVALDRVSFAVPEGAICALVGTNGAGKTTLVQILAGLRRGGSGTARVLGRETARLSAADRSAIGYVAEGMSLPRWMRLRQLEAYLAPLCRTWDTSFADELRNRFRLNPDRRLGTFSRGEHMKAAILCALAPRPRLLLLDEPFTGIDVIAKDEIIRGLLASAELEGWSALICSHDVFELEALADWLVVLDSGYLRLADSIEKLRERFIRVDALVSGAGSEDISEALGRWLTIEQSGQQVRGIVDLGEPSPGGFAAASQLVPGALRVEERPATLREIITATSRQGTDLERQTEEVAA